MKFSGESRRLRLGAAILALVLVAGLETILVPERVEAKPSNGSSCTSCHSTDLAQNSLVLYVNGVAFDPATEAISVPANGTFHLDFYATNTTRSSNNSGGGHYIAVQPTWTVTGSTAYNPFSGNDVNWNNAVGVGSWNVNDPAVASGEPSFADGATNSYSIDFNAASSPYNTGAAGSCTDDGTASVDPDGVADRIGGDAAVTVGGTTGTFYIWAGVIGHTLTGGGKGTKGYELARIQVDVTGAGNNPPAVPANPAQYESDGSTAVALGGYSTTTTLVFEGDLTDPDADTVKLQIDINGDNTFDCESALVASGSTNVQVTCAGLTDGTGYDWQYRAVDSNTAASAWTAFNAVSPDFTVDTTAPTDGTLGATPGDSQVDLDWSTGFSDTTSGIASYDLRFDTAGPVADCASGTSIYTGALTTFNHGPLSNGTTYYYRVCATDNAGLQSAGATASATPSAGNANPDDPANLAQYLLDTVTPIGLGGYTTEASVVFEADIADSTDVGDTVKLQIDTDSNGIFDCESALGANPGANVQVACALADGAYDWQVRTVDNLGATSAWVPFNAASPDFIKDASAPVDGTLTANSGDSEIVLTWTAASDPHSGLASPAYTVSMATGTTTPPVDCSANIIYTGDALTHTETGLTNGVDYAFRLCADNNAGLISTGTTDTTQPAAGCVEADPTVTILTADQDILTDGGFVNYTVQVTNNDSAACADTPFILSASDTNGTNYYASSMVDGSLTIAPGSTGQTQVRVTARAGQPNLVTNDTTVSTAAVSLKNAVTSAAVTTTINVAGGGCVPTGDYLNTNGDRFITSR